MSTASALKEINCLAHSILSDTYRGIVVSLCYYTVSQKTTKIIFVIATSNFHQIRQYLAYRWQNVKHYMRWTHFPPHLSHVNADVPNCYITLYDPTFNCF